MFDRLMKKIVGILPEKLQKLYYRFESAILYIFFGGLTTVVSISVQYISAWLGGSTAFNTTLSWICAVTFAFFVNKICVFKSVTSSPKEFIREMLQFFGARLVSYFLELGFMVLTVDVLHFNEYIMKLIAQIFVMVINYLFSKLVIFRKKDKPADSEDNTN